MDQDASDRSPWASLPAEIVEYHIFPHVMPRYCQVYRSIRAGGPIGLNEKEQDELQKEWHNVLSCLLVCKTWYDVLSSPTIAILLARSTHAFSAKLCEQAELYSGTIKISRT